MNNTFFVFRFFLGLYLLCFSTFGNSQSLDEIASKAEKMMMTDLDSSFLLYQHLEKLAIKNNNKAALGNAIINSAGICNHIHQYEKAREICNRGLALQPSTRDSFEIFMTLGQSYDQDNAQKAESFFRKAEKIALALNDSTIFADFHGGFGKTSFSQGQFYNSLNHNLKVLNYLESPKDDYRKSSILVKISNIFLELENIPLTEQYLMDAIKILEDNNYKTRYARASIVYANLLLYKNEIEDAQIEITKTKNWIDKNNKFGYRALNTNTQASIFIKKEKWDQAEDYINQAFEERKKLNSTDFINYIPLLINRCSLLFYQKKYDQVLITVQKINELTHEYQSPIFKKKALEFERKVYEKKNQIDKAYLALQEIRNIEGELFQKDQVFSTNYLESEFNRKEQETAIALLDAKNEIQENQLSQQKNLLIFGGLTLGLISLLSFFLFRLYKKVDEQKTSLAKAVGEKDTLLREIHHRVKNNLQLVSSLLGLQSDYIQDPQALEAINSGKSRVKSMALIHQDLYKKENLTGLSAKKYLQKLTTELFNTFEVPAEKINLKLDVEDLNLDVDTLVPLGLIINELITNSLKYAFPNNQKGFIYISLLERNNQLHLTVADDGIGINDTNKPESGFGFQLIETLLEQLEGEMKHQEQKGTHLSFKMNYYKKAA